MGKYESWHENDEFWEHFGPVMFSSHRRMAASSEIDDLLALMCLKESATVLDLACGPGRHALELAQRGFRVTGVDRTESYVREAKNEAIKNDLDVEFVLADMREFVRVNAFDAVINLYTSFGYFRDPEEDRLVVKNVNESLRPGGFFVIETHGNEEILRSFHERDLSELDDGSFFLEERTLGSDNRSVLTVWTLLRENERYSGNFAVRYYAACDLADLLRSCGFSEINTYGNLRGIDYDDSARSLVVVARK